MKKLLLLFAVLMFSAYGFGQGDGPWRIELKGSKIHVTDESNGGFQSKGENQYEVTIQKIGPRWKIYSDGKAVFQRAGYLFADLRDAAGNPWANEQALSDWADANTGNKSGGSGSGQTAAQVNAAIAGSQATQDGTIATTYETKTDATTKETAQTTINTDIETRTALNDAKLGMTAGQAAEITANTAKVGITPAQTAEIAASTAADVTQNTDIAANTAANTAQDALIATKADQTALTAEITRATTAEGTKVNKPVGETQGKIAVVDATGNDVEYVDAPSGSITGATDTDAANKAEFFGLRVKANGDHEYLDDRTGRTFFGTDPEWNALSAAEQSRYSVQFDLTGALGGAGTDDQNASEVPFTPNGNIAATDVQAAIQEVRDEAGGGGGTDDQTAAEVPNTPSGNLAANNVQDALNELQTELDATGGTDDDITAVTFDGTNLTVAEGATNFSADISGVDTDTQLSNAQVSTAFLAVNANTDLDSTDDFDGAFGSLTGTPAGLADGDDDTVYDDTAVQAAVALNTAKVGISTAQATDITTNNAKVGITAGQAADIVANTAKVGITTAQANEIAANTLKVTDDDITSATLSALNVLTINEGASNVAVDLQPVIQPQFVYVDGTTHTLLNSDTGKEHIFRNVAGCDVSLPVTNVDGNNWVLTDYSTGGNVRLVDQSTRVESVLETFEITDGNSMYVRYVTGSINQYVTTGADPYTPFVQLTNLFVSRAGSAGDLDGTNTPTGANGQDETSIVGWTAINDGESVSNNTNLANVRTGTTSLQIDDALGTDDDGSIRFPLSNIGANVDATAGTNINVSFWFKADTETKCEIGAAGPTNSALQTANGNDGWQQLSGTIVSDGSQSRILVTFQRIAGTSNAPIVLWVDDIVVTYSN